MPTRTVPQLIHYPNEEEICLQAGLNSQSPSELACEGINTLSEAKTVELAAIQLSWQSNSEYLGVRNFTIIITIIATTNKIN